LAAPYIPPLPSGFKAEILPEGDGAAYLSVGFAAAIIGAVALF